jgi:hypothetical protein
VTPSCRRARTEAAAPDATYKSPNGTGAATSPAIEHLRACLDDLARFGASRPGSAHRVSGATVVRELVLRPVDRGTDAWAWGAPDGTRDDTAALVSSCLALLVHAALIGLWMSSRMRL